MLVFLAEKKTSSGSLSDESSVKIMKLCSWLGVTLYKTCILIGSMKVLWTKA